LPPLGSRAFARRTQGEASRLFRVGLGFGGRRIGRRWRVRWRVGVVRDARDLFGRQVALEFVLPRLGRVGLAGGGGGLIRGGPARQSGGGGAAFRVGGDARSLAQRFPAGGFGGVGRVEFREDRGDGALQALDAGVGDAVRLRLVLDNALEEAARLGHEALVNFLQRRQGRPVDALGRDALLVGEDQLEHGHDRSARQDERHFWLLLIDFVDEARQVRVAPDFFAVLVPL